MGTMKWQPAWWDARYDSAWDRVKEAMRRDWEQTRHHLSIKGGHELNQGVGDTMKQAMGTQPIPDDDRPNPPKVVGGWDDVEPPMEYGFAARVRYGEYPEWSPDLERALREEWEKGRQPLPRDWATVREHVKHGFEAKH